MASTHEATAKSLSLRGINREYPQYGRGFLSELILRQRAIPYRRHGRYVVVMRRDWEAYLEDQARLTDAAMTARVEAVVEHALEREAAR